MNVATRGDRPSLPVRAASALRMLGAKRFLATLARRALSHLVRMHTDIVLTKDLALTVHSSSRKSLKTAAFEGRNLGVLQRASAAWPSDAGRMITLHSYARSGYRALFAEIDSAVVGYMWWVDGTMPSDRRHPQLVRYDVPLGPTEAWAFDFFLAPEHRGGGNSNEFLSKFEGHLRSRGFTRAWGFVASNNKPARWLYSLSGWKPHKVVKSVELLRRVLISETGLYLKNSRRRETQAHDYRRIASWRPRPS